MRTLYVGMDIHKNFIQAAAMDQTGTIITEQQFKSNAKEIKRFVKSLKTQKIHAAIEATCTWYHVYETLDALGVETTLVNMRRTKTIADSKIKTDKLDAKTIAQCLRTGFIATAYIPPKTIMEQRTILRHRMSLRKEITRYKNKIHAILLRNGIPHSDYSDLFGAGGMRFLRSITLPDSEHYSLTSYLNIIETLIHEKTQTAEKIETLCKNNQQAMLLTSIPGISYYGAMIILTEIGEIHRFPPSKETLQLRRTRPTDHPIRRSCLPRPNPERM
ncbi:MAG: IS110 family transposase [Euryarchaeota archaeon]|nr:IS110 family transposase [Euryarchaeota archaeon]